MKSLWTCIFLLLVFISSAICQSFENQFQVQLSHSLDYKNPNEFTSRGNITIISVNSADYEINQKELKQNELKLIKDLAKDGRLYRLRAEVVGSDGKKSTFLTSSKACHLLQSQLHDFLTFSFDHNNVPISINLATINMDQSLLSDNCDDDSILNVNEFNTVVTLKNIEVAPTPDTVNFIQKLEREREQRERGEGAVDKRSFIQKYWMYLVPAVILLLISGVTNPEQNANGGGSAPAAQR